MFSILVCWDETCLARISSSSAARIRPRRFCRVGFQTLVVFQSVRPYRKDNSFSTSLEKKT
jgi:hypothetical protein